MEIRQLKYFVQIAKDQNYTVAAKKLYITQPTLSWTIKQLEEELGVKLFTPHGKKLLLTPDGEELLQHAKYLLQEHQKVVELFQSRSGQLTGYIHLGIPTLFGTCFFMNQIMSFMDHYPKIKVTMYNSGSIAIQEMVEAGTVELGIVSYLFPSANLEAIELPNINYPIVVITSKKHPLAAKSSLSFADLKNETFILLSESFTIGELPLQACMKAGYSPNVAFRSSEWDVICEAVANSNNISILPYPFLQKSKKDNIAIIPLDDVETLIPIAIITKKDRQKSLPLQKFIQFMLDNILNSAM